VERVLTIGVYGWEANAWLSALASAGCDRVVDIRARRGVRGREYEFANHRRLEALLRHAGIAYLHLPELAPSREMRDVQAAADAASRQPKRARTVLDAAFAEAYEQGIAAQVDWADLVRRVDGVAPALLCVERLPTACHRSIAASRLAASAGVRVEDLIP
jgi:uncharacterized protein (DUF488 family)